MVLHRTSDKEIEIKNIAVSEALQGKGIGSYLVSEVKRIARRKNVNRLIVGTPGGAFRQIKFYEQNGFVKYDLKKDFFVTNYFEPIIENKMNLNQVTVPVLNVEKSIEFYEKLGLKLIVKELPTYARFECPDGDATFSLHKVEVLPKESSTWIYFEAHDLDNYVQQLINKGIGFEELPTDKTWLWRESRLKDLDNNQIIIYLAGHNIKNPPWKIA